MKRSSGLNVKFIFSAFVIAASMLLLITCKVKKTDDDMSGEFTDNVEKSGEVVLNPGQGWILYGIPEHQSAATLALGTTGYSRYDWAEINPREDVYNWALIDDAITAWARIGKQFSFGVMNVNTFNVNCTPKWVFDKGAKYTMGNGENSPERIYYIPVWDDPVYVGACKKFAKALAERYDGNSNIAFIDIRNYGNWGEMHMHPFYDYTKSLTTGQVQSLLIQPYIDSFKKTQLVICYGAIPLNNSWDFSINNWAVNNGIGLRLDGIMGTQDLTGHSGNGEILSIAFGKQPVVWEILGTFASFENNPGKPWNDDRFLNNVKTNKPNYIGMGQWNNDAQYMLSKKPKLVREVANLMGFNFSVTSVSFNNMKSGMAQKISLSIENSGVTVMLTDCVIKLALVDSNDALVTSFTTDWDAKSIKGGSTEVFKSDVVFANTPAGSYKLAIGLFRNEKDPKPTYNLDNKPRTKDGFYVLGAMIIE